MSLTDRQRPVRVSLGGEFGGNKLVTRYAEHGSEDPLIPDAPLAQLPLDHLLAAQDEFRFRRELGMRQGLAVTGTAGWKRHGAVPALLEALPADNVNTEGAVFIAQGDDGDIRADGIFDLDHLLLRRSHVCAVGNDEIA